MVPRSGLQHERFREIGEVLIRDAFLITDAWMKRAAVVQPSASRQHQDVLRDELPYYLRSLGEEMSRVTEGGTLAHENIAYSHGEQRWRVGWEVAEVVRDYQIMRTVVLLHLHETLDDPLSLEEILALNESLDVAIQLSIKAYTSAAAAELRTINESLEGQVVERTQMLSEAASDLVEAEQAERERISDLLHDHHQQILTAIRLRLTRLKVGLDQEELKAEIDNLLADAIVSLKTLSTDLNPTFLPEEPIAHTLRWLADRASSQHQLDVRIEIDYEPQRLPVPLKACLYQAAREALFNVVKHSEANTACLQLSSPNPGRFALRISDAGPACSDSDPAFVGESTGGLETLRRRLRMFDGKLHAGPTSDGGFAVEIELPIPEE